MSVDVVFVKDYPSNKSTTWHFKKLKDAYDFLRSMKKIGEKGYYCLNFFI